MRKKLKKKTKVRNLVIDALIIVAFMIAIGAVLFGSMREKQTASASTMPKYTMTFAYDHYYHYNTSSTIDGSADATTAATVKNENNSTTTVKFYLYSSSISGEDVLPIGDAITERNITIAMEGSWYSKGFTITNSAGEVMGSSNNGTLTLNNLADGRYYMTGTMSGYGWNPNPRSAARYSMSVSSRFIVDCSVPTISGASTSQTGMFTNSTFTVNASDSVSGVENLYMKSPNSSSYTAVGTSRTVMARSTNGLYSFYAKDKANNVSATHYVFYDSSLPTITLKNASGSTVSGDYINTAFSCSTNDTGSGVSYLEYKTPSLTSWTTYTSGTNIATSEVNGLYQFRAVDKAGNVSAAIDYKRYDKADGNDLR